MPINSRNKGAQFERNIAKILNDFFTDNGIDFQTKRNLDQYQEAGQCDLDIPFHAVECKFYKDGEWLKSAWWDQVCSSSNGRIPVLIFKFNRRPIRVCIPLYAMNLDWPAEDDKICVMAIDDWLDVLKKNWRRYEKHFEVTV